MTPSDCESPPPDRGVHAAGPRPGEEALRGSYLDLLKLCLCDLAGAFTRTVTWTGDRRLFSRELSGEDQLSWRIDGKDWPENGLSMIGLRRLDDLQACVESVVRDRVAGDLVEAGTWRGGAAILMRATLDSLGADDRAVWVADSFQGFPLPEASGSEEDRELELHMSAIDYLAPTMEHVSGYFARFGCEQGVNFVPGFFEETMNALHDRAWSVVRLDADTYKATRLALEALYPGLSVGGYLVLDDYYHPYIPTCARRAVDEYRSQHGITEPVEQIDWNSARWRRETESPATQQASRTHSGHDSTGTPRALAPRSGARIPTDRELELTDEITGLRARLSESEAQRAALEGSAAARATAWAHRGAMRLIRRDS
jgi:O-methyltransferase